VRIVNFTLCGELTIPSNSGLVDHSNTYPPHQDHREEETLELSEHGELLYSEHPDQTFSTKRPTYEDGNTIDWLREENAERERRRCLKSQRGVRGVLLPFMDASRMWFVIVVTGIGIGVTGAWLDVLVKW